MLLWILLGLIAIYWGGCWLAAGSFLSPFRIPVKTPAELRETSLSQPDAEVPMWVSPDLLTDSIRREVFIFAHGYGNARSFWRETAIAIEKAGYGVVVLAMPGQDKNPRQMVGFGTTESELIVDAVSWVLGKAGDEPLKIILVGVSMGGAASWLASEKLPQVSGVVTEGAYARFGPIPGRWLDLTLPMGNVILRPVIWFAKKKSGLDPDVINPVESAAKWSKPALVIHAERDRVMTHDHASELREASQADFWVVPGAAHSKCQTVAPQAYVERLISFAQKIL